MQEKTQQAEALARLCIEHEKANPWPVGNAVFEEYYSIFKRGVELIGALEFYWMIDRIKKGGTA